MNNKPEFSLRLGAIEAAGWKNTAKTKDGQSFERLSVKIEKRVRDADGNWKGVSSYSVPELMKLRYFCDRVIQRALDEEQQMQRGEAA